MNCMRTHHSVLSMNTSQ